MRLELDSEFVSWVLISWTAIVLSLLYYGYHLLSKYFTYLFHVGLINAYDNLARYHWSTLTEIIYKLFFADTIKANLERSVSNLADPSKDGYCDEHCQRGYNPCDKSISESGYLDFTLKDPICNGTGCNANACYKGYPNCEEYCQGIDYDKVYLKTEDCCDYTTCYEKSNSGNSTFYGKCSDAPNSRVCKPEPTPSIFNNIIDLLVNDYGITLPTVVKFATPYVQKWLFGGFDTVNLANLISRPASQPQPESVHQNDEPDSPTPDSPSTEQEACFYHEFSDSQELHKFIEKVKNELLNNVSLPPENSPSALLRTSSSDLSDEVPTDTQPTVNPESINTNNPTIEPWPLSDEF
jgi:hypothetical protein